MVLIKRLLVFVSSVTALTVRISKRDVQTLASDTDNIDAKIQAFASAANSYDGGAMQALPIYVRTLKLMLWFTQLTHRQNAGTALQESLKQGTTTAQAIQAPVSADHFGILVPHFLPLLPDVQTGIAALKGKKDLLVAAGVIGITKTALVNTKAAQDTFADSFTAVVPAADVDTVTKQRLAVDAAFQDAIDFSRCNLHLLSRSGEVRVREVILEVSGLTFAIFPIKSNPHLGLVSLV